MAESGDARHNDANNPWRDSRRPISEFLPYLPYRPHLARSLGAPERTGEQPYLAYRPHLERSLQDIAKQARTIAPDTDYSSGSATTNSTSRSISTRNSYVVNPPLARPSVASPTLQGPKVLPLPPSLMVKTYRPPTGGRRSNPPTPLGSEANPAELMGTPPWEWLPELPG